MEALQLVRVSFSKYFVRKAIALKYCLRETFFVTAGNIPYTIPYN